MRHFISAQIAMATIAVAICAFITACSSNKNHFSVDARFLNMNQADFYVYSPDGAIQGVDTIHVNGGRFTYEGDVAQEGTLVLVFPNFAVMPVFIEPGADITIEANAAHLKEMEVTGNDANEAFTKWRKNTTSLSPNELPKQAENFVNDNLTSPVSIWMIRQYFVMAPSPDYNKANALLQKMHKADEGNAQVLKMMSEMSRASMLNIGDPLPHFSATDINGKPVSSSDLMHGNTIILAWSTFNFESQNMLRQLKFHTMNPENGEAKIDHLVTICVEPDVKHCRRSLRDNDATDVITICDTELFDSPLLKALGFTSIPDNARFENGKLKARRVELQELFK